MAERRGADRIRTFLRGRIIFNNRSSTFDCLVRDMSTLGARLAVSDTISLPDGFSLYVPQRDHTYKCSMRWRRPGEVGVVFGEERDALHSRSIAELLGQIAELEAENASLRRRISAAEEATA